MKTRAQSLTFSSAPNSGLPLTQCKAARTLALNLLLLCVALSATSFAQTFTSLVSFDEGKGANPYGTLVQGVDGNFYGTTQFGGANGQGTVFKATPGGVLTTLYSFCSLANCADGFQPFSGLVVAADGLFYGTTISTAYSITLTGMLTTLHTFCSQPRCTDGSNVYGGLVQGVDGNFYGTTHDGGVSSSTCSGCGTIFRMTPTGTFTTLYTFHGKDGYAPYAGLIQGGDGNFYGTTTRGGANQLGTIFRITPAGVLTLLHSFNGTDGSIPYGTLVQGKDHAFYGTTASGGANTYGTVFRITRAGNLTVLHSFNVSDGEIPYAGVVQATDGAFYGTTFNGGRATCSVALDCGTIFRVTPSGKFNSLYRFCSESGCADGGGSFGSLIQASDGDLYGTTVVGGSVACGADGTCGTVFRFSINH